MIRQRSTASTGSLAAIIAGLGLAIGGASIARAEEGALRDGAIGYTITHKNFAVWTSADGKTECPQGYNHGPREQFKALYPDGGNFAQTQLEREAEIVLPDTTPEPKLFYREPVVKTGLGLNLDGKVDENDFMSPEGEQGIDNQMYRVVGCTESYRGPDGSVRFFIQDYMRKFNWNRWIIELTNVDDLANDSDVTVNLYRGLDELTYDAAGNFASGGTQRVDTKWGKEFIYKTSGKIEGGVLTTTPIDIRFPESLQRGFPYQSVREWRVKLRLTEDGAEGLMAGYLELDRWHRSLFQQWPTHNRSYGAEALPSQYRALRRHADAYPNEKGENTHISTAWEVRFSQAFILHPPQTVAIVPTAGEPPKKTAEE
jgi:hypothetical protein